MGHQVLDDGIHVHREQNPLAQRVLVEQRRYVDLAGCQKRLHQPHQLEQQVFPLSFELVLQLLKRLLRGLEHQPLQPELLGQLLQVDGDDLAPVGCAAQCGGNVCMQCHLRGVNRQRRHLAPLHHQLRAHHLVHAQDVGPFDLVHLPVGQGFDLHAGLGRRGWRPLAAGRHGHGQRHAKHVHKLGRVQARFRVDVVGHAAQAPANHLLAQQLAGEGAQAHDVRHGLGVPAL